MLNRYNFLLNYFDLLNFVMNQWNLDGSVSIYFNEFVDFNQNWYKVFNSDKLLNFDWFINKLFDFNGFDDFVGFSDKLFNESVDWNNLFYFNVVKDNLFFEEFNFSNFCLDIRNNLFDFSDLLSNNWHCDLFNKHFSSNRFYFNFNNLFNCLRALNNLFNISFNWDDLFDNSVDGNWYLDGNYDLSFNFNNFTNFMSDWDNSVNIDFLWYLNLVFDDFVVSFLNNFNCANNFLNFNNFLNNFFNDIFF